MGKRNLFKKVQLRESHDENGHEISFRTSNQINFFTLNRKSVPPEVSDIMV